MSSPNGAEPTSGAAAARLRGGALPEARSGAWLAGLSPGALVLAGALPVLFLHAAFQPSFRLLLGSTPVEVRLSDLAVLAVAAAALAAGRHGGFGALRAGSWIWATACAFLAFTFLATLYPLASEHAYPWKTHLVTAVKFSEYALLALAVPLLLRGRRELRLVLASLVAWSVAATAVGLVQFLGARIVLAWPSGGRQPSFVGVDDFAALSAAAFVIAFAAIALGPRTRGERALAWAGAVSGLLGLLLSSALAAVLGTVLAAGALAFLARRSRALSARRGAALVTMVALLVVGSSFMRSAALGSFARFLGLGGQQQATGQVESYSQRWILDYIGLRIFLDHPLLGAGWQSGYDEETYGPYLADARHRYPTQPARAFPSPEHPWGIQNAYVQALAELGLVGFALFGVLVLTGLGRAARLALRGPPRGDAPAVLGVAFLLVAAGLWNGLWLIAGIPFDALVWLGFGLAASPLGAGEAA